MNKRIGLLDGLIAAAILVYGLAYAINYGCGGCLQDRPWPSLQESGEHP